MDIVDNATRSRMMSGIRGKNTKPETAVDRYSIGKVTAFGCTIAVCQVRPICAGMASVFLYTDASSPRGMFQCHGTRYPTRLLAWEVAIQRSSRSQERRCADCGRVARAGRLGMFCATRCQQP